VRGIADVADIIDVAAREELLDSIEGESGVVDATDCPGNAPHR